MAVPEQLKKAKQATQWIFLVCGLGMSTWAPLVPFVKDRLHMNDADLGLLLLLLGFGAMLMMPLSGMLVSRYGTRVIMALATVIIAGTLPLLAVLPHFVGMAITLFLFGGGIGMMDVAMNAHGVYVQNRFNRSIMSSLHGLFSLGGLFGSLGLGMLIKLGLNPFHATIAISLLLLLMMVLQYRHLFSPADEQHEATAPENAAAVTRERKGFQWLNKSILLLGFMCFTAFLSEGAMLDWGAVFLRDVKGVAPELAGAGYATFSIAMAAMRLMGDRIIDRLNSRTVVVTGSLLAFAGLLLIVVSPWLAGSLAGFGLLGVGASNIVPVFFSEAGRVKNVSPTASISAMTTMGYSGQLVGPAFLGWVANRFSLNAAFVCIAFLMLLISVMYRPQKN